MNWIYLIGIYTFGIAVNLITILVATYRTANNENCYLKYRISQKMKRIFFIYSAKEEICILAVINQAIGILLTLSTIFFLFLGHFETVGFLIRLTWKYIIYFLIIDAVNAAMYHFFS